MTLISRQTPGSSRFIVRHYLVAVLATSLGLFARWLLDPWLERTSPTLIFAIPIVVSAYLGGLGPGLVATALGAIGSTFFMQSRWSLLVVDPPDQIRLAILVIAGAAISWLAGALHAAGRRLEAQKARLEESDEFHQAIADLTTDFAFKARLNPGGAVVTEAITEGFTKLLGYSREELEARGGWPALVHPEDRGQAEESMRRLLAGQMVEGQLRHVTREGRVVWLSYRHRPVEDSQGRVVRLYGAFQDITGRREAEDAARANQAQLRRTLDFDQAIMANMGEGLYAVDAQGLVTYINPAAERLFGWSSAELLGRKMHDATHYKHADDSPFPAKDCAGLKVLEKGTTISDYEDVFIRRDGTCFPVVYSSSPLKQEGRIIGLVVVFRDVTAQKQAEAALKEADRRKDEFLAVLAHELRNPLAPISNAVQVLRMKDAPGPAMDTARDLIGRQVRHLARLIDDLLDVSRITRSKLELRKERVELGAVVQSSLDTSRPLIEALGHQLTVRLPSEPVYLYADPTRLAQVLWNLLNNAAKYTPREGDIRLIAERQGNEVVIWVRDSGVGIASEHLANLFQIFSQVTPALERSQEGLGIGLSLVRALVEMHGGSVEARSEGAGKGSEFIVRLPLQADHPLPATAEDPRAGMEEPAPRHSKSRILVVDDTRDSADSLATLLRLQGHDIHAVYDGLEGVAAGASFRPNLVMLDIGMPKMNGYEAARRIREQPWGKDVVLVAMTGWGQDEDKRRAMEAGFDHHLTKPVEPSTLYRLLAQLQPGDGAP